MGSVCDIQWPAMQSLLILTTKHLLLYHTLHIKGSLGSAVSIMTELWAGWLGFDFWQGQGFFLLTTAFRQALEPTHPPIKWLLRVKWPGCETNYSSPSSAEVKNMWSYTSTPPYVLACCLIKHRDTSTLPLLSILNIKVVR
jgi:hypothetical protein